MRYVFVCTCIRFQTNIAGQIGGLRMQTGVDRKESGLYGAEHFITEMRTYFEHIKPIVGYGGLHSMFSKPK